MAKLFTRRIASTYSIFLFKVKQINKLDSDNGILFNNSNCELDRHKFDSFYWESVACRSILKSKYHYHYRGVVGFILQLLGRAQPVIPPNLYSNA